MSRFLSELTRVCVILGFVAYSTSQTWPTYIAEACSIYCYGDILATIQLSGIYNDSKAFVDMPMKFDPAQVQANFDALPNKSVPTLQTFLDENFDEAGSDLVPWIPGDFLEEPEFLEWITNETIREWAFDINQLWLQLGKEVTANVTQDPQRHSFVPIQYPMIVPGGRFVESYYWDSYWIVRGLLVCDMAETAWNVIGNLLSYVDTFSFVPNGGRIYYLDRSQPPMLTQMIAEYLDYIGWETTEGLEILESVMPTLNKEYEFWMTSSNNHVVEVDGYTLNVYHSNATIPRPESYVEDINTCSEVLPSDASNCYRNIRSGAETGWDFSSRWLANPTEDMTSIVSIQTTEIVPIDLNAIMYRNEITLASMSQLLASSSQFSTSKYTAASESYLQSAQARSTAIQQLLWDEASSCWLDYNLSSHSRINAGVPQQEAVTESVQSSGYATIASWIPMWAGLATLNELHTEAARYFELNADKSSHPMTKIFSPRLSQLNSGGMAAVIKRQSTEQFSSTLADDIVNSLENSGLIQAAGILTSNLNTGQQWDSPNAWPPLVMFTIEGLQALDTEQSNTLAASIIDNWINTNYLAYSINGYMYEKYNAFEMGVGGGGGEYSPQIGFGWTNGVSLTLIQALYPEPEEPEEDDTKLSFSFMLMAAVVLIGMTILFGVYQLWQKHLLKMKYYEYIKLARTSDSAKGFHKHAGGEAGVKHFVENDVGPLSAFSDDPMDQEQRREARANLVESVI